MLGAQRKHSVVLSADAVGYSLMMAHDAAGTFEVLLDSIQRIERQVECFGGRIVDAPGDNVLAELPNEQSAMACAIQIQRSLEHRNRSLPEARRMHFRIGLHSGAVLAHGGRLYGDVVNIAARLQSSADADGILVSDVVANRVNLASARGLRELGPHRFKNIPYAVTSLELRMGEYQIHDQG